MKFSLDRVIKQLTGTPGVEVNATGSLYAPPAYRMPARTAQEVKGAVAADDAVVSPQQSGAIADPAARLTGRDPNYWRKQVAARQQPKVIHDQPVGDDNGEVSWLL